ncbi:hypothetical protein KPA97_16495, partial [Burkholderia cenocepacia]|nr:hypothetical protein [Burkholderia cenocepacia]
MDDAAVARHALRVAHAEPRGAGPQERRARLRPRDPQPRVEHRRRHRCADELLRRLVRGIDPV